MASAEAAPLLDVAGLSVAFRTDEGALAAVNDVSFSVGAGERVGIVGESGSGKSQILMAIMGLLAANGTSSGSVRFRGAEILNAPPAELDRIRGSAMSMIFQDPMTSLNPYMRVESQLTEVLTRHRGMNRRQAATAAVEMLERVKIPDARGRIRRYPHEFSGGMRQRVMISMALLCQPALIFADEPTTALDVTVQAEILALLAELSRGSGTTVVLVTHDLGVVAELCDRVIVLYGGRIMEQGTIDQVFYEPKHPYTQGLLASTPRLDASTHGELSTIGGQPPSPLSPAPGCPFEPRCAVRLDRCAVERPVLAVRGERAVACHLAQP